MCLALVGVVRKMSREKILSKEAFGEMRERFRREGKTVVLCHGVFDLLHYGHIEHLAEAKSQGDILVVSVTAAEYVNKGPGRPYFNDEQRLSFLASIEYVDYVLLSEAVTVHEIVKFVKPDVYVKGQEYSTENNDVTGNIGAEQKIVEHYGGRIYFTQGAVYSSTKLLNNFFDALPEEMIAVSRKLKKKYGADIYEQMRQKIEDFSKIKVLVIGDIIIDEYIFCSVQGVTMKDAALSVRYDYTERYIGGALAIARHISDFVGKTDLLSMMGYDKNVQELIEKKMQRINCRIVQDKNFRTPIKRRYLKQNPLRQEYDKLFSVNDLPRIEERSGVNYDNFYRNLQEMIPKYDLIVVCDYGHGLIDEKAIKIIEEKSRFLSVNCQTNSSNLGANLITKYHRADAFVVDEREAKLPFGQTIGNSDVLLERLADLLKSKFAWLTVGANGAFGIGQGEKKHLPALTLHVKDTVGAGDAFYSLATLTAIASMPIDQATLVCNIAGAIKSNLLGNSKPVKKVDLLKFLATVLNV